MVIPKIVLIIIIIILLYILVFRCNCAKEGFMTKDEKLKKAKEITTVVGGGENFPKYDSFKSKMKKISGPTDIVSYTDIKDINKKNGTLDPKKVAKVLH